MPKQAMVPILLLTLWMAPVLTNAGGRSTLSEHIELDGATEIHEYELNVPQGADEARLVIRAKVKSGKIRWTLTDAEGEERLQGHGERGNVELDTGQLENPTPGVWRLEVDLEKAKGHYRVEWRSSSE